MSRLISPCFLSHSLSSDNHSTFRSSITYSSLCFLFHQPRSFYHFVHSLLRCPFYVLKRRICYLTSKVKVEIWTSSGLRCLDTRLESLRYQIETGRKYEITSSKIESFWEEESTYMHACL